MEIRAAEISAILKKQIADFDSESEVAEVGQVLSVGDGIARVYGLDNVRAGEMVEFPGGIKGIRAGLFMANDFYQPVFGGVEKIVQAQHPLRVGGDFGNVFYEEGGGVGSEDAVWFGDFGEALKDLLLYVQIFKHRLHYAIHFR